MTRVNKSLLEDSARYEAIFGFDGYIDSIYKVIRARDADGQPLLFNSKEDFAQAINNGKSADIELERIQKKRGGNAPIAAEALSKLGVRTLCAGMTDDPMFQTSGQNLEYLPIGIPSETIALEFSNAKLMLADANNLHSLTWNALLSHIPIDILSKAYENAVLVGFFNWSASASVGELWRGLREHVLISRAKTNKNIYFDLSDPARRTDDEIRSCISLINDFAAGYKVTLGMNLNEAQRVSNALKLPEHSAAASAAQIFAKMTVDNVVVHSATECANASVDGLSVYTPVPVENPKVLTGAGDAFSAGYCLGLLRGFPAMQRLIIGCMVAGKYIENGEPPALFEMKGLLPRDVHEVISWHVK